MTIWRFPEKFVPGKMKKERWRMQTLREFVGTSLIARGGDSDLGLL